MTLIFCFFLASPEPAQSWQGLSMTEPSPLQVGHVCAIEKRPELRLTCPEPWHVGQTRLPPPSELPDPWQVLQESFFV